MEKVEMGQFRVFPKVDSSGTDHKQADFFFVIRIEGSYCDIRYVQNGQTITHWPITEIEDESLVVNEATILEDINGQSRSV